VNGLAFFYLIFWTTFAPQVLFLQILWKSIQKLFQIVKGIEIWLQEAFLEFEIPSPVSNAFPLTIWKLPLNEIVLLAFKRVFEIDTNLKSYFHILIEN
jgi:hypothetical protein